MQNLVGRIDHIAHFGMLVTDFRHIKAGLLHRANGGYLLVDAIKLLTQPFAWSALKRALLRSEIRIESLAEMFSMVSTIQLEPQPIPLDVKVVLVGEREICQLLQSTTPSSTSCSASSPISATTCRAKRARSRRWRARSLRRRARRPCCRRARRRWRA